MCCGVTRAQAKLQQLLMGATPFSYWASRWLWDTLQVCSRMDSGMAARVSLERANGVMHFHNVQYLVAWAGACVVVGIVGGDIFTAGSNFPTLMLLMLGCVLPTDLHSRIRACVGVAFVAVA